MVDADRGMKKTDLKKVLSEEPYSDTEKASQYMESKRVFLIRWVDFLDWSIIPMSVFLLLVFGVSTALNINLNSNTSTNATAMLIGMVSYFVPDHTKKIPYILYKLSFIVFSEIFLLTNNPAYLSSAVLSLSSLLGMVFTFCVFQAVQFSNTYSSRVRDNVSQRAAKIIDDFHAWNKTEIKKYLDKVNPRRLGKVYALYYTRDKEFFYVGQTHRSIGERVSEHRYEKDFLEDFDGVLIENKIDIMDLDAREIFWIREYSKIYNLINKTSGGSALWKRKNSKWIESIENFENKYKDFYGK